MFVTEFVRRKRFCRRVKMCKVQMLRALVKQRLTAAAEEIFGLFERTIAESEQEVCRLREDNERLQKLLDAVFKPQLRLHRAGLFPLLHTSELKCECLFRLQQTSLNTVLNCLGRSIDRNWTWLVCL